MKNPSCLFLIEALEKTEELSNEEFQSIYKFIQTIIYNRYSRETLVETRIRLYQQAKRKSSATITPDPSSMLQDIKRGQLQLPVWIHCLRVNYAVLRCRTIRVTTK